MNLIFELSKEHKTLPSAEIQACLQGERIKFRVIEENENVVIVNLDETDQDLPDRLASRLSFTYFISELLFQCSTNIDDIKYYALSNPVKHPGSLAIRWKNRSRVIKSNEIIKTIAEVYTKDRKVDLNKPAIEIRVVIADDKVYAGLVKNRVDRSQFEERRVQYRPFFSPISLHPKIARSLVNLSCIKPGESLLDPFCGTGGILVEAGLMGLHVIGSDIDERMIAGCKKTLDYYNIPDYELYGADIGEIHRYVKHVDAIVTDLPYGRAATTKGENKNNLYERAFQSISKILKKNRRAVIGSSSNALDEIGGNYLSCVETHILRVHKSLTRYFTVYKK